MSVRQQKGQKTASSLAVVTFLERHNLVIAIVLVAIASARIVATYTVFNHTFDEPAHIACGMEWLDHGSYHLETQHPPLARIAAAFGPFLLGVRSQGTPAGTIVAPFMEGNAILMNRGQYDLNLAMARLGILPFFWLACIVVYRWGSRYFSRATGVTALFLFSFLPPVLAHAGLATTDMALTAFLGAAFLAGLTWAEAPTRRNAMLFGAATGLGVLSKFSFLVFFPAIVILATVWYFWRGQDSATGTAASIRLRIPTFAIAVLMGMVVVWAGYRFSLGSIGLADLWSGIRSVMHHNAEGHPSYLLGQRSQTGFWYFYPVVLAFKTPLVFLVLLAAGLAFVYREIPLQPAAWMPLAFAAGILAVAVFSRINIGVRHILPVYIAFSVLAALAVLHLWDMAATQPWLRIVLPLALVWFAGNSLWSQPDYLAYFNEWTGSEPEKIAVESDLDWGQDMKRLAARLNQAGARAVTFNPFLVADFAAQFAMPPILEMDVQNPSPGWNAVSVSLWKARRLGLYESRPEFQLWPDHIKPLERVGKSTLLWYFVPAGKK